MKAPQVVGLGILGDRRQGRMGTAAIPGFEPVLEAIVAQRGDPWLRAPAGLEIVEVVVGRGLARI